mgnify:CR=1 FL=1
MINKYRDYEIEEKCKDIIFYNKFKYYLCERSHFIATKRLGHEGDILTFLAIGLLTENQNGSRNGKIKKNNRPISANRVSQIYNKTLKTIRENYEKQKAEVYKPIDSAND